jgi:hypothetical protein
MPMLEETTVTSFIFTGETYGDAFVEFGEWLKTVDHTAGNPNSIELLKIDDPEIEHKFGIRFSLNAEEKSDKE